MNEVLLRGCTIKNSGAVHGLVIYTGAESRIQMNAARPPKKTGVPVGHQLFCMPLGVLWSARLYLRVAMRSR